ncbi:hypothetical protein [Spirosoma gilvum]
MASTFLTYRQLSYHTDLTPEQIGQRLSENVITGFTFYSHKPYYGDFTPYSFSVRKAGSKFKKESMSPTVEGSYRNLDGTTNVMINIKPSPVLIITFFVFAIPLTLFVFVSITEFFRTLNLAVLVSGFVPLAILYGIIWLIFQSQSRADILFWEYTLALRQNQA